MEDGDQVNDEYEYEYDETVTETFLVDLDLSSLNASSRSRTQGGRKSLKPGNLRRKSSSKTGGDKDDPILAPGSEDEIDSPTQYPEEIDNNDINSVQMRSRIQILDFNSYNPIISYQDQIYSCTWTDMIGTNMFFNLPHSMPMPMHDPLRSTDDYELTGTSRIKLVGHRAKMTTKSSKKREHSNENSEQAEVSQSQDQESQRSKPRPRLLAVDPQVQLEVKRQTEFLEKLKAIQRSRVRGDSSDPHFERNDPP